MSEEQTLRDQLAERDRVINDLRNRLALANGAETLRLEALEDNKASNAPLDGYVLAKETVVEMPDGKRELGYTLLSGIGVFESAEDVFDAISEMSLPLGWVSMTVEQLLPGSMTPMVKTDPQAQTRLVAETYTTALRGNKLEYGFVFKKSHEDEDALFDMVLGSTIAHDQAGMIIETAWQANSWAADAICSAANACAGEPVGYQVTDPATGDVWNDLNTFDVLAPVLALEDLLEAHAGGKTNFQIVAVAEGDIEEPNHIQA